MANVDNTVVSGQETVCSYLLFLLGMLLTIARVEGTELAEHRLLFGTNTSNSQDEYVQIARIEMPDFGNPNFTKYNGETGEIGGHGEAKRQFKFDIIQRMRHDGEVNKARYMPQNPNIIATMSSKATAQIFDRSKHPLQPKDNEFCPQMILTGHSKEGFGLNWSPHLEGQLATASEDTTVCLYDIRAYSKDTRHDHKPLREFKHHTATVNDVEHHPKHPQWVGTVSDDLTLQIVDTRKAGDETAAMKTKAHTDAVNCLAFHPKWETMVATGSADSSIALWDLRNLETKLHSIDAHKNSVIKLEWHPQDTTILGSGSYDRRINFYDISKAGEEQTAEEAEDGPPELYVYPYITYHFKLRR